MRRAARPHICPPYTLPSQEAGGEQAGESRLETPSVVAETPEVPQSQNPGFTFLLWIGFLNPPAPSVTPQVLMGTL